MKKITLPIIALLFTLGAAAQNVVNPFPKTITVNGSAEMEITPDEIYVQVDLKEYDKKGGGKVQLDAIRKDFLNDVRSIGLPDSAVTIAYYDSWHGNPWLRKKNKKHELFASISYQVKLKTSDQMDALVEKLDDEATQNFFIIRTSHSKLDQFRKQLKIDAVKAAKDKASYLAAAIDETVGTAVTINEPGEYYIPYYNQVANMRVKEMAQDGVSAPTEQVADFRKIKLKYDVTVVFALK
jgi:uncharacterized protein YggE